MASADKNGAQDGENNSQKQSHFDRDRSSEKALPFILKQQYKKQKQQEIKDFNDSVKEEFQKSLKTIVDDKKTY